MLPTIPDMLAPFGGTDDPRLAPLLARMRGLVFDDAGTPSDASPDPDPAARGGAESAPAVDRVRASMLAAASGAASPPTVGTALAALLHQAVRLAYELGLHSGAHPTATAASRPGEAASTTRAAVGRPSVALRQVLDLLAEGVALIDGAGRTIYVNSALAEVLREDEAHDAVVREMRRLALSLPRGAAAPSLTTKAWEQREVSTKIARYLLRGAAVDDTLIGMEGARVVTVDRLSPRLPVATSLTRRFGLTACEAGVALLLSQGYSNLQIARKMAISPHTARHHTENVLLKLDVHSRAEVGPTVLGTRRPSAPVRAAGDDGSAHSA